MSYGSNIYNNSGGLVFSSDWSSLVHVGTVTPRNYDSLNLPGICDFELPDNCPDDVIPFVQYTGTNPSAVYPTIIASVKQNHNYSALCRVYTGTLGLCLTPRITNYGTIMTWGLYFNKTVVSNPTSYSNLTLTFSGAWTTYGFPSTITVNNIPPNSGAFVIVNMINKALKAAAGVETSVNYVPNNASLTYAVIAILPKETMGYMDPSSSSAAGNIPPAPTFSWTATPSVALTVITGKATSGKFYNTSSHAIIPQIGDVIIGPNNVEYTITGMSGTPTIPDQYSLDYHLNLTLTTSPALPSVALAQCYRIKRIKRYIRVFTGNISSETPNHKLYLFAKISQTVGSGYGMRMYNSSGNITFDSNQRMLVLAGRGTTPSTTLNYPDSSGTILTIPLDEGTIPTNYAIHCPYIGIGRTAYGSSPSGVTTTTRDCMLHLKKYNSNTMGVYWSNNYPLPASFGTLTGAVGFARPYWNAPFFIIDTDKYA